VDVPGFLSALHRSVYFIEPLSLAVSAAGFWLLISGAVLFVRVVAGIRSDVASPIPSFVRVEVVERLLSALGHRSFVTVARIVAVIDVTGEASGSMEPWARPDEYPTHEKIRSIVAVGGTGIRSIVKVPVRANRLHSNANGNLTRRSRHTGHQRNRESKESKRLPSEHNSSWSRRSNLP
jgi:hypothetical protein